MKNFQHLLRHPLDAEVHTTATFHKFYDQTVKWLGLVDNDCMFSSSATKFSTCIIKSEKKFPQVKLRKVFNACPPATEGLATPLLLTHHMKLSKPLLRMNVCIIYIPHVYLYVANTDGNDILLYQE